MTTVRLSLTHVLAILIAGGLFYCQASPLLFTNSGAGKVGIIAGSNVTEIDTAGGNLTAPSSSDMVLGSMLPTFAFQANGPSMDTGMVDFSSSSLTQAQNCNAQGGGGPATCFMDAQSAISNTTILGGTASDPADIAAANNEMAAVSSAWAAASGKNISLNPGGTINATDGNLQTVTVLPVGASSFSETGYVFTVTDNGPNPNQNIVINGDGSHLVILNYAKEQALTLSNNITLAGGITSDQVLINITDGSTTNLNHIVQTSPGVTIDADLIVTSGSVQLDGATLNGRLYLNGSGVSQLNDGFTLNATPDESTGSGTAQPEDSQATPEPAAMILLGMGLSGLAYLGRRAQRKRQPKRQTEV